MSILKYLQESLGQEESIKWTLPEKMTPEFLANALDEIVGDMDGVEFLEAYHDNYDTFIENIIELFADKAYEQTPNNDEDGVATDRFEAFLKSDIGEKIIDDHKDNFEHDYKEAQAEKKYGHPSLSAAERNR